jgi:hypothetical protein
MSTLAADSAAVAGPLEMTSLLAGTAEVLASLLRADWAGTIEIVEDQASLRQTTWSLTAKEGRSPPDVQMASRLAACSMAAWALESGRSVTTSNLGGDRRFVDAVLKALGIRCGLCVPILFLGVPIGALGAYRNRDRPFSAADVATAEKIVQPLAALLAAIRGQQALRAYREECLTEPGPTPADKRRSPRRKFRCRQWIAPQPGADLPRASDFCPVECRDLSVGGVAFYLAEPPPFEELIVALGTAKHLKHYRARVMRVQTLIEGGRKRIVVGCRFTERVSIS